MAGEATPNAAGTPAPTTTPQSGVQGSATVPVSSGVGGGSGTPNPTPAAPTTGQPQATPTPPANAAGGFNAANSPATQTAGQAGQSGQATPTNIVPQPATFDDQFRQRYGMDPSQAQMLLTLGWRTFQGQKDQQQGQANPQPAAAPKHPWGIPQIDPQLLSMVERDPASGRLLPKPGAPPDAALRVQQYLDARESAVNNLFTNPAEALKPIVTELARAEADRIVQERMGGVQAQGQVNQIIADNSGWLFQKDQQGNPQYQFDPASGQNKPVLSAVGKFYAQRVQYLHEKGVRDPAVQHELAYMATRQAVADIQARQAQQGQQGQQANQAFLAGAAAGQTGNANPNPTPSTTQPGESQLSSATLKDVMRTRLERAGVTEQMVRQGA